MTTPDGNSDLLIKPELEMMRSSLNFATSGSMDDYDPPMKKCRQARDPMSHRIIEKRRRDRMNNCLADLSQLIPQHYIKQGQGRIEKTEIIEMAISHIRNIKQLYVNSLQVIEASNRDVAERFWLGYREAMDEVMRFLVEKQNYSPTNKLCVDLQNHLQAQSQQYKPAESPDKKMTDQMREDRQTSSGIGSMVSDTSSTDSGNRVGSAQPSPENNPEMSKNLGILKNGKLPLSGSGASSSNAFTDVESGSTSGSLTGSLDLLSHDGDKSHRLSKGYSDGRDSDVSSKQHTGYNFKKYIKQRFTKAASSTSHSDIQCRENTSMSYEELDSQHMKEDKKHQVPSPGSESTASPYPVSESSSNSGNVSNDKMSSSGSPEMQSSMQQLMSSSSSTPSEEDNNWPEEESRTVPGFALHPNATYYIPIVINTNQLMPYMKHYDNMSNAMRICHPVSIPVNFGAGHFMSYQVAGHLEGKPSKKESSPRSLTSSRTGHSRMSSHSSRKHRNSTTE